MAGDLFSIVRRRIRDGQKTRYHGENRKGREGYRFSLPSTTHPRPRQSAPLRCIAAGDAAKCDAAPFLGRRARCERSSGDASPLPEEVGNDGRRKSDIELRNRAREVVRQRQTRGKEREREQQRPSRPRCSRGLIARFMQGSMHLREHRERDAYLHN